MWFQADFLVTIVPIFVGIAAVLLLGFIVIKCIHSSRKFKRIMESPIEQQEAVVLEKTTVEKCRRTLSENDMTSFGTETVTKWQAAFRLENGETKTLAVPEHVYGLISEGDHGTLTFQDEQFLKFERS